MAKHATTKSVIFTKWYERLRSSLWLVPAAAAVVAFAAAKILVAVDGTWGQDDEAWFLFGGGSGSALELLSTISSSMMTFTGLVFSITILVLQLASSQFSPRVLRTFLQDRGTQIAMGAFVGTFVFSMALVSDIRSRTQEQELFVPALAVFVAFVLVLVSVGVFIHYIDHMAHSVRAITIIKRVAEETRHSIRNMYPEEALESPEEPVSAPAEPPSVVVHNDGRAGVLSAVDEDALMQLARETRAIIGVVPRPGDFVPHGAPLVRFWGSVSQPQRAAVEEAVLIADERTPHQDPAFGFRQLVDVAERALSPSMNDPTTAVQALDELHDLLRMLVQRRFPSPQRVDEDGALRLVLPRPSWEDYVHLALDEIRQYGGGSIQVVRRLRALLEDCAAIASPARRACLEEQLRLLDDSARRQLPLRDDQELARKPSAQGQD